LFVCYNPHISARVAVVSTGRNSECHGRIALLSFHSHSRLAIAVSRSHSLDLSLASSATMDYNGGEGWNDGDEDDGAEEGFDEGEEGEEGEDEGFDEGEEGEEVAMADEQGLGPLAAELEPDDDGVVRLPRWLEGVHRAVYNSITRMHRTCSLRSCRLTNELFDHVLQMLHEQQLNPSDSLLWEVDMSANRFTEIPRVLEVVSTLGVLHFSYNRVEQLSDDFSTRFAHLKRLNLSNNQLRSLPNSLRGMSHRLGHLDLSNNAIDATTNLWPLTQLQALQVLLLHGNRIENIEWGWATALPKTLVQLTLGGNQLAAVPADLIAFAKRNETTIKRSVSMHPNPWGDITELNRLIREAFEEADAESSSEPSSTSTSTSTSTGTALTSTTAPAPTRASTSTAQTSTAAATRQPYQFGFPSLKELCARAITRAEIPCNLAKAAPPSLYPYVPVVESTTSRRGKRNQRKHVEAVAAVAPAPLLPAELEQHIQSSKRCVVCDGPFVSHFHLAYRLEPMRDDDPTSVVVQVRCCSIPCLRKVVLPST